MLTDSSAYLALLDANDRNHQGAVAILQGLAEQRYRQFTTSAMLYEAHALILSELGTQRANHFLRQVLQGNTTVIRVRSSDEEAARDILFRYTDKTFSYNDAISFAVMHRLGIALAFSFDDDFRQYGLTMLTPDFFR